MQRRGYVSREHVVGRRLEQDRGLRHRGVELIALDDNKMRRKDVSGQEKCRHESDAWEVSIAWASDDQGWNRNKTQGKRGLESWKAHPGPAHSVIAVWEGSLGLEYPCYSGIIAAAH